MSLTDRIVGTITDYSKIIIAVMVILTVLVGAGASQVEQTSSLDQFQSDTPEAQDLEYINENFSTGSENTTSVQVIVRGENVLNRTTLLETLRYEQALLNNETINRTLASDSPPTGIANIIAQAAIQQDRATALNATAQQLGAALETVQSNPDADVQALFEGVDANTSVDLTDEDFATFQRAASAIRSNVSAMQNTVASGAQATLESEYAAVSDRRAELNRTGQRLRVALGTIQADPNASVQAQFDAVDTNTSVDLTDEDYAIFADAASTLRSTTDEETIEAAFRQGTQGVLADEAEQLGQRVTNLNGTARQLGGALGTIAQNPTADARALFDQVEANTSVGLEETNWQAFNATVGELRQRQSAIEGAYRLGTQGVLADDYAALTSGDRPSLAAQIDQLESMSDSAVRSTASQVLSGSNGAGVLNFMSTDYDTESTSAEATMVVVTQVSESMSAGGTTASDAIIDAQLAIQDLGQQFDQEYLVFGSGIISHEITQSMSDSMLIVGPLALLFVLLALAVGYRDVLDIILGLAGIGAVLVWTFGFMGWANIDFNQIFIAVPVLLIGLSIDYAIHIFMRHREERTNSDDLGPRGSMRTALAGVGVALTLVTATTVIGFLSNLTSPIGPIREFGIVSAVGITAALLVFGVLIPALKVEVDSFLENHGIDRHKRAIGTSGGLLSRALRLGSIGAKKAPYVVIILALLLSAGGAYAGSQVDTSFAQEDFIAEDPPGWMDEPPEPFKPSEYTAKDNLNYVDEHFGRENSQAQLLIRGDVATPDALARIDGADETIAGKDVTQKLANGEPDIQSPLSVMRSVAASNETFNATFSAATNDEGLPVRNISAVYETLYEVAPQEAQSVLYRVDGEYEGARIVVSIQGTASSGDVTDQMRDVASTLSTGDLEVSATGQTILFEIVQTQLLETVIESLLITLVAVFAFLMVVYRISDGSATLGFVTLLPVVLSVAWILGTMYAFDIPFNVMTGMITSLTVGLGVAYSIHLSERYNQELERVDSAWEALDRAVTGTGGALLGSAATTVGGFGVLVFAILPPLQQFGLITGLTIIYAFLASVIVLPSLLVVWTRLFGPEDAFEDGDSGDDDGDNDDDGESEAGDDTDSENDGSEAGDDKDSESEAGDNKDSESDEIEESDDKDSESDEDSEDEIPAPADDEASTVEADGQAVTEEGSAFVPAERTGPTAERIVTPTHVAPGKTVAVTLSIDDPAGRVAVSDHLPGTALALSTVEPDPTTVVVRDATLFALWEGVEDRLRVEYEATVSDEIVDGTTLAFDGAVRTKGDEQSIEGADSVTVVADVAERALAAGAVSESDLRAAADQYASGHLPEADFERVCAKWVEGSQE